MLSIRVPFDPLSDTFARDPYPAYAALRAEGAPHYFEPAGCWLLSRFDDVAQAALDPTLTRTLALSPEEKQRRQRAANFHDMPAHERFVQFSMLDSDGPVHDRLRRLVIRELSAVAIPRVKQKTQALTAGLLGTALEKGRIDFIEDFAAPIPGAVIGWLLGAGDADGPRLRCWSEDIVQYFDIDRSDAKKALAEQATGEFHEYLAALCAARRAAPQDDILSRLVAAQTRGELNEDELISTAMLILMAGHGSTIDVMGSGLNALMTFPAQMARLRADPALMATAVQEMFRFESPLPFFHRHVTQPVRIAGRDFLPGETVGLLYGSANRDETRFAHADVFDVGRSPNRHLAFGAGAHFCLGNHLARQTMEIAFAALLSATRAIEPLEHPRWRSGLAARGPLELRVALTPA